MAPEPDVLELLLPDLGEPALQGARRVTTFLRLLADDARGAASPSVGVDPTRAARELERHGRERLAGALEDLLRHHLHAALSPDSFHWFGTPELPHPAAWSRLEEARAADPRIPPVPAPGEPPLAVARRLVDFARGGAFPPPRLATWEGRLAVAAGEAGAEARLVGELDRDNRSGAPGALARADAAAAALDRGDPRTALTRLGEAPLSPGRAPLPPGRESVGGTDPPSGDRGERLRTWALLVLAADGSALPRVPPSPHPGGPSSGGGPLPRPLLELREAWPAALPLLAGPLPEGRGSRVDAPALERRAHGASALIVLERGALRPRDAARLADLAPALTGLLRPWLARRDGAWTDPRSAEHALLLQNAPVVRRALPGDPAPRGALGPGARALALAPAPGPDGELVGWVHMEFEHLLVPSRERLLALGRAAGDLLGRGSHGARHEVAVAAAAEAGDGRGEGEPTVEGAGFHALVDRLGTKLAHRRWYGFLVGQGRAREVARGGGLPPARRAGGGRALARALDAGGAARFDGPDPPLALGADACSGVVVPARLRGRVVALLAIESGRRRDFRSRDVERLQGALDGAALTLRLAAFRSWHRRRFGSDRTFPPGAPGEGPPGEGGFAAFAGRLVAAGRSRTPVVLEGPVGSGRRTLARWLHFEHCEGAQPLVSLRAGDRPLTDGHLAGPGTLLVEELEGLDAPGQSRLLSALEGLETLEGRAPVRRLVATTTRPLGELSGAGLLHPELARRLDRLRLVVPPLADRREELPGLLAFLLARFGEEEGLEPPRLEDEALALLWRQAWPGDVAELENAAYKLVLARPAEVLGAREVGEVLGGFGVELARRLPSRHPRRADLVAALAVTRRGTGRLNKTRAALYLGWDPDTLVARMEEARLDEAALDGPRGWDGPG